MTRASWRCIHHSIVVVAILALFAPTAAAQAPTPASSGVIEGRVTDGASGDSLPGARLTIPGSAIETSTDRQGLFRLTGVPAGQQTILVSYLGRRDETVDVEVIAGSTRRLDVNMGTNRFEESVTVPAELIRDAQARALNQQKTAANITNVVSADQIGSFPDGNAAETVQRIPGISITKDQGEGRYVNIRGTDARLNSMMINGERIPAPDPLLRQVALDVVPSELLQAIEVSKALTPDMDADAIGGSVNLVMKNAPEKFRVLGAIGGGYNQMLSSYGQNDYTLTGGRRFGAGRWGVIGSVTGSEIHRGNQDMEAVYTNTLGLNELNPRYYQVNRRRTGATGAVDFRAADNSSYTVRAVFNRFIDDHENRQRVRWLVGNSRIDRELRDRTHIERIGSLGITGHTIAGGSATLDYELLGAYSDQFDPLTMTTTFRESRVTFAPNVSATSIDPNNVQANATNDDVNNYNFQQQVRAINFAKDRDVVAAFNARLPLRTSNTSTPFLKVGFKYRDKAKGRDRNETTYTTPATLKMTNFLETGFDLPPYLDGRYDLTPYVKQSLVAAIPDTTAGTVTRNHTRDAEEFDGTERTSAAYGMVELYAGPKLLILPGVRFEYTAADFIGRNVRFAPGSGAWLGTDPLESTASTGVVLPSVNVRYATNPNTNLRLAVTRSLARPNYYDIVPYRAQDDNAATIALGNAELSPTTSWNFDALIEHYFASVGAVSGGLFYKNIQDYIFSFASTETINGTLYQVTQPLNGDSASVRGVETSLQNRLSFLPGPLNGIGVYANYTFTSSSAQLPGHGGRSGLPGQSKHSGNLAASYEKAGFAGRVAVNFHGSFIEAVGATSLLDRIYDRNSQLDVSMSQKVSRNFRVYLDMLNLNDALLRYYQGVPERVLQEEHYHWWAMFGVRATF
jgi:TonB-dependent receptor